MMPRCLAAGLAVVLFAALPAVAADAGEPNVIRPVIRFTMDDRFGPDGDADGLVDLPNTAEYVHGLPPFTCGSTCPEARFPVTLRVGLTGARVDPADIPVTEYRWTVSRAPGTSEQFVTQTPVLRLTLPEGEHDVSVSAGVDLGWTPIWLRIAEHVVVDDLLVVAIGDSYASGEGNPEVARGDRTNAVWADSYDAAAMTHNITAHRSTIAWPARVALALERADDTTSVTFVSLASSGASIDRALLGPQRGMPPQVDELRRLVGERTIDILLIQVGGNDIGFTRVIQSLVEADPLFDPVCHGLLVDNTFASVADGDWSRGVRLAYRAPLSLECRPAVSNRGWGALPGIDGLPAAFDRLSTGLAGLDIGRTVLVGYPDPTGSDASGATCEEIVGDATAPFPFHEIDQGEQRAGVERLLRPLNATLEAVARRQGWSYVGGVSAAFAGGHGYCAPRPDYTRIPVASNAGDGTQGWYRNPGAGMPVTPADILDVSWYRTAAQSATLQGPAPRFLTTGTLHPNELGHQAIAHLVLAAIAAG